MDRSARRSSVPYTALDDGALLALIARSNTEALSVLYDRYSRLVYTVAVHVVGDTAAAEEITQDVFVRVWESATTYRSDLAKVSSWMVSITRYRAIDELRRRKARPQSDLTDWFEDNEDRLSDSVDLEDLTVTAMQRDSIRQGVASLPPDQQQALRLAFFKGMTYQEIAEQLGEPLGTVKSRICLAMRKLRDYFLESGLMDH